MTKILFLPVGIGLAHIGRLVVLARELKNRGFDVIFGAGGDTIPILIRENLPYVVISEFERNVYEEKIKKNNFMVYSRKLVEEFVKSELEIYKAEKPDLIVYDTRLTVKFSAQIAGIPTVSVANVDATPFYDFSRIKIPHQTLLGRYLSVKTLSLLEKKYSQKLLRRIGPSLVKALLLGEIIRLSPVLIKLGYKISFNPYQCFLGDLTLLCDIPEFRPMKQIPCDVKIIGPVFWEAEGKLPSWHKELEGNKEIIYVTASGTGDKKIFLKTLEFLKDTKFTIVTTTGNTLSQEEVKINNPKLYVTDFLPGKWVMPKARLIIFPGGNATCYQSLSYGVPQICTPLHLDQEDNANQLERLGTGIMVNPYVGYTKAVLLRALNKILNNKRYFINASKMKDISRGYNGKKEGAEEIVRFFKSWN